MRTRRIVSRLALAQVFLWPHGPANAQDTKPGPTAAEFKQLQGEVAEQRQLIIQLMQNEQQRYDMLLRLIQGGAKATELPPSGAAASATATASNKETATAAESKHRFGFVEGKVTVPGGDTNDVYVYIEDVKSSPLRGHAIEIKQENKQFSPRVAVVQTGTTVSFPNMDPLFHNVFSNSPRNSFDLGSYRAGDKARSVVMTSPGVVDIFCNMHSRMSASVLVVPSRLFAKVRPDGTFRIENVPVGARQVVAWSPSLKPVKRKIDIGVDGGRTAFDLEYTELKGHNNKLNMPYGSYKE